MTRRRRKPIAKAAAASTETVAKRPAETGGVSGAVVILVGKLAGIDDPDTLAAMGIVVGILPAAITWVATLIRGT